MNQDASAENLEDLVGYVLKQAAWALRGAMDTTLRPMGLTVAQYACLELLGRRPGLSNAELARGAFVSRQAMNGVLRGLQERGLVARPAAASKGRALPTELTDSGREQLRAAAGAIRAIEQRMVVALSPSARVGLRTDLATCQAALTGTDPREERRPHQAPTAVPPGVGDDFYGDDMDIEALDRFVIAAKATTYVAGGPAAATSSRPGSHELSFADGEWTYLDSYFGGQDFLGQEVVWYRGEPAWAMNYYGWINTPDQIDAAQAGRVVMAALSRLYEQHRFLGGHDAQVEGWEYHDRSDGNVAHFSGREWINQAGSAPVYELVYHGGLVRPGPA